MPSSEIKIENVDEEDKKNEKITDKLSNMLNKVYKSGVLSK